MLFEGIDEEQNKDKKLSLIEKGIILAFIPLGMLLLRKLKRSKTYGDVMKVASFIENKLDDMEEKYGEDFKVEDEETAEVFTDEINTATVEAERI